MKKLVIFLLLILTYNISSAQSGWGYVNYTSYKLYNGNGSTNQYQAFPYSPADFDVMFNTTNSNTTIFSTGEVPMSYLYAGSLQTPHWNGDYFGFKFEFWFIPKVTGTYYFGTNSDDASDILIDGVLIASYYGGHGASGYRTGQLDMVAGNRYKVVYRGQEYGGGEAFYFRWYRPGVGWGYWNDEVTNIGVVPTKQAKMTFDFGNTLDKTKFSIGGTALSSTGIIDVTNSLDSNKVGSGSKATIVSGQVEWSVMNIWNGTTYVFIDARKLNGVQPIDVKSVKVLDLYDGPVTFYSYDGTWAVYSLPISVPKLTDGTSTFNSLIRPYGGIYYGISCDVSFTSNTQYKPQSVTMTTTNNLSTLYNSIVTVSDVWLAFKEVSNIGLFGNQTGNEFGYGIQYKNADVNDDGVFNEEDTYRLLQHLTGARNLVDTFTLPNLLKIIPTDSYNQIGKSNWTTFPSYVGNVYNFDINTTKPIDSFYLSGTWKGDVNLSHSAIPTSNGITTMSMKTMNVTLSNEINATLMSESVNGKLVVTISVDPLQQELVGTQFQLNYDNSNLKFEKVEFKTKGNSTNFGTDKTDYISLGSLVTDGSTTLDKTTEYKITFAPLMVLSDILGLTSISVTDAVNKNGTQLKIKVN